MRTMPGTGAPSLGFESYGRRPFRYSARDQLRVIQFESGSAVHLHGLAYSSGRAVGVRTNSALRASVDGSRGGARDVLREHGSLRSPTSLRQQQ